MTTEGAREWWSGRIAVVLDTMDVELPQVYGTRKEADEQADELNSMRGPAGRWVVREFDSAEDGPAEPHGRCNRCRRLTEQAIGTVCGYPVTGLPAGDGCGGRVVALHEEVDHLERAIGDLIARVWRLPPELRQVVLGDPEPGERFSSLGPMRVAARAVLRELNTKAVAGFALEDVDGVADRVLDAAMRSGGSHVAP